MLYQGQGAGQNRKKNRDSLMPEMQPCKNKDEVEEAGYRKSSKVENKIKIRDKGCFCESEREDAKGYQQYL